MTTVYEVLIKSHL